MTVPKRAGRAIRKGTVATAAFLWVGLVPVAPAAAAPDPGCDYNGDGKADLALGWSSFAGGEVVVHYGSPIDLVGAEVWDLDSAGIKGTPSIISKFGAAVTCGDFDNDGFDDLAIGSAYEFSEGFVNVIYGSAAGLTEVGDQLWEQDSPGIKGVGQPNDFFGGSLATGDFNGDGYFDLAIGAPGDDSVAEDGGQVNVLYGSNAGLTDVADELWDQDTLGIQGILETGDYFGFATVGGDFDDDGFADLAIGVPYEDVAGFEDAGIVQVIYGSAGGLTEVGDHLWHRDSPGIKGTNDGAGTFGFALTGADFDDDGVRDLAIGVPADSSMGQLQSGSVNILYGLAGTGLNDVGDQLWTQDSPGIKGVAGRNDFFGISVSAGNFNGDGYRDLAIGAFLDRDINLAGSLHILYGSAAGIIDVGDQQIAQDTDGIKGTPGIDDQWAASLRSGDFDGDGRWDIAVGACQDNDGGSGSYGSTTVIYGSSSGISTEDQMFVPADFFEFDDAGHGFGDVGARKTCY